MTVTQFTGATLPPGWTAQAPAGASVDLPGDYLQLTIDPGQNFNSLFGSNNDPEGPLVWRTISGAFDYAVGLAEEACNLPNQGLDLLGLDNTMLGGVRAANFSGSQSGDFRSDIGWFVFATGVGNVLSTTGDAVMGGLYGGPGWLRLAWDGVNQWTYYASHTGHSGTWAQVAQFTEAFAPTRFAIHATATPSGTAGRVQRVQRVVDLLARGTDDATDEPTVTGAVPLFSTDFASGALPGWLTAQTANGGQVTTDTSGSELRITEAQQGSRAWLLGPGGLPESHGLLIRYQLAEAGYLNAFWVPTVAVDTSTDIAGAETPDDKFGPGTSLLMEMPAREHASQGTLLRLVRRSPIRLGASQTGTREFDGYTLMIEDPAAPVGTVGLPLSWLRLERVGHSLRFRVWLDGDPEPSTWLYQAQDHMRHGDQVAITLSQNDSVSGAGAAAIRVSQVEIYELEVAVAAAGTGVGFGGGLGGASPAKLGTGTASGAGGGFSAASPAKVGAGAAYGHGGGYGSATPIKVGLGTAASAGGAFSEATAAKLGAGSGQGQGGGFGQAQVTSVRQTRATAFGGGTGRCAVFRTAAGSGAGFGGGFGAHRPAVVVIPGVLTAGLTRSTLTPGATRPTLTAGSTRPVLTPGRSPSG